MLHASTRQGMNEAMNGWKIIEQLHNHFNPFALGWPCSGEERRGGEGQRGEERQAMRHRDGGEEGSVFLSARSLVMLGHLLQGWRECGDAAFLTCLTSHRRATPLQEHKTTSVPVYFP